MFALNKNGTTARDQQMRVMKLIDKNIARRKAQEKSELQKRTSAQAGINREKPMNSKRQNI